MRPDSGCTPRLRVMSWSVAFAIAIPVPASANRASETGPTTIASIRAACDHHDAGGDCNRSVTVRGRVTWVSQDRIAGEYAAVQDDTAGIWIDVRLAKDRGLWNSEETWRSVRPGMLVEIAGLRDDATFAPEIIPRTLRILSQDDDIQFPEARVTDPESLFSGVEDSQRITTTGVLQQVRDDGLRWILTLEAGSRRFRAAIPKESLPTDPATLVDGLISIKGVATTRFTTRGQLVMPNILVARGEDLRIVEPPRGDAFATPDVPLERIARFMPEAGHRHRIRTRGVVSYTSGGNLFYMQSAAIGVRVEATNTVEIQPGDLVDVTAFIDRSRVLGGGAQAASLIEAQVRKVGHANRPTATAIQPERILETNFAATRTGRIAEPGDYDGCLIECKARLTDVRRTAAGGLLLLTADRVPLTAAVSATVLSGAPDLEPGSELLIRGIVQFDLEPRSTPATSWNLPVVERISLIVPSADDITVIRRPPWWTVARLTSALAAVAFVLAAALAWVMLLRRQVRVQAALLAAEIQSRRETTVEFEATLRERSRLAGNLHDTVLQTVTGISYQLTACKDPDGSLADDASRHLATMGRMVEHAVQQLRGAIWALRAISPGNRPLADALAELAGRLGDENDVAISVHAEPIDVALPDFLAGNLLLITQEALLNAVRHARAKSIEVSFRMQAVPAAIELTISDDGIGFTEGAQGGAREGHFGIAGMRERADRIGGVFVLESEPGKGTRVAVVVPVTREDVGGAPLDPLVGIGVSGKSGVSG